MSKLLKISKHGAYIPKELVSSITSINSRPIRINISRAKENEQLFDMTFGEKSRSLILDRDNNLYLSSIPAEDLQEAYDKDETGC